MADDPETVQPAQRLLRPAPGVPLDRARAQFLSQQSPQSSLTTGRLDGYEQRSRLDSLPQRLPANLLPQPPGELQSFPRQPPLPPRGRRRGPKMGGARRTRLRPPDIRPRLSRIRSLPVP